MKKYDLYQYSDYKQALKDRVSFLKAGSIQWTFKKLADKIPVQYTFLSKVLNSTESHLNEDHLFRAAMSLDFLPDEIDYLLLLRSSAITGEFNRKEFLTKKIENIKKLRSISANHSSLSSIDLQQEMAYLLNPLCMLIHVALSIPDIQKNPQSLCSLLGLSHAKLRQILELLEANNFIELGEKKFEVIEVKDAITHFGREHPLMRIHQTTLKSSLQNRLNQTQEDFKESFFVTFLMDDKGFEKIQNLFKKFIADVQQIKNEAEDTNVFQLSFDMLKWF